MSTFLCRSCGSSDGLPGGHTCAPAAAASGTTLGTGAETAAARNTTAGRLTDDEVDRIAERVTDDQIDRILDRLERRLTKRRRARGRV
jgi:hypothetical protein